MNLFISITLFFLTFSLWCYYYIKFIAPKSTDEEEKIIRDLQKTYNFNNITVTLGILLFTCYMNIRFLPSVITNDLVVYLNIQTATLIIISFAISTSSIALVTLLYSIVDFKYNNCPPPFPFFLLSRPLT